MTLVPTRSPTERDGFTSLRPLMLEKLNRGRPHANELSDTPWIPISLETLLMPLKLLTDPDDEWL